MRGVGVSAKAKCVFGQMEAVFDGFDNSGPPADLNGQAITNNIDRMNGAGVKEVAFATWRVFCIFFISFMLPGLCFVG